MGDGHALSATEAGNVTLEIILENGKTKRCRLHNVVYEPKLAYNLLSISKVTKLGKRVEFYSNDSQIFDQDDKVVAVCVRRGNLYYRVVNR